VAIRSLLVLAVLATSSGCAMAQAERVQNPLPTLHFAEMEIVEAIRPSSLKIDDPIAVFSFVFRNIPERARIYPTENYYYFRFTQNGTPYTGNIRLAAADRDQGKVHFAYGERTSDWRPQLPVKHIVLDASNGIAVERLPANGYRISHDGRSVTFLLNDLSQAKPLAGVLRSDEKFLGTIFDESAVRFFLIFNSRLKIFHYLLDETAGPGDDWAAAAGGAFLIGKRTGFAIYRDGERKVLIGVHERNSRLNTLFDGPFDQLPENEIEGEALRAAIVAADRNVKGKIDRLGNFLDGSGRYLIHPYMLYRTIADLAVFHRCATARRVRENQRPRCFVIADSQSHRRNPLPLALQKR
jgi:hypothetical protein